MNPLNKLVGWNRVVPVEPGVIPLELSLAGVPLDFLSNDDPRLSGDEIHEVVNGFIPKRSLPALHARAGLRMRWLKMAWSWSGIQTLGLVATFVQRDWNAHGRELFGLVAFSAIGPSIAIWFTLTWAWLSWDLRERRLSVQEGDLTCKGIGSSTICPVDENRLERASLRTRLIRLRADYLSWLSNNHEESYDWVTRERREPERSREEVFLVKIGGRTQTIHSLRLFSALGTGVRYRLYLSAHARLLVAIEARREHTFTGYRILRGTPMAATPEAK